MSEGVIFSHEADLIVMLPAYIFPKSSIKEELILSINSSSMFFSLHSENGEDEDGQ